MLLAGWCHPASHLVASRFADANKEQEMKIGNPTDVKHVAHIGWDNASSATTTPSWVTAASSFVPSAAGSPPNSCT
jgi:hypothetical protein